MVAYRMLSTSKPVSLECDGESCKEQLWMWSPTLYPESPQEALKHTVKFLTMMAHMRQKQILNTIYVIKFSCIAQKKKLHGGFLTCKC